MQISNIYCVRLPFSNAISISTKTCEGLFFWHQLIVLLNTDLSLYGNNFVLAVIGDRNVAEGVCWVNRFVYDKCGAMKVCDFIIGGGDYCFI